MSPTERVVHRGSHPQCGSISNHRGVDVSRLCLWCVASHHFWVFITEKWPIETAEKEKWIQNNKCVLFTNHSNNKLKNRRQNATSDPSPRSAEHFLFANTPINIQMHRSKRWLFTCLCCHTRRSSRWDKGGDFSFQCQNKRWSDDMRNRLLVCLVLLAIMALLIKAVQTCWDISNSSTPSNLLQGCTLQNLFL